MSEPAHQFSGAVILAIIALAVSFVVDELRRSDTNRCVDTQITVPEE